MTSESDEWATWLDDLVEQKASDLTDGVCGGERLEVHGVSEDKYRARWRADRRDHPEDWPTLLWWWLKALVVMIAVGIVLVSLGRGDTSTDLDDCGSHHECTAEYPSHWRGSYGG